MPNQVEVPHQIQAGLGGVEEAVAVVIVVHRFQVQTLAYHKTAVAIALVQVHQEALPPLPIKAL